MLRVQADIRNIMFRKGKLMIQYFIKVPSQQVRQCIFCLDASYFFFLIMCNVFFFFFPSLIHLLCKFGAFKHSMNKYKVVWHIYYIIYIYVVKHINY